MSRRSCTRRSRAWTPGNWSRADSAGLLTGYYDAVHEATTSWAAVLGEADLDRIVDDAWDPPVTLGVRLVSVLSGDLQHAGQAAYVRGLVLRDT
ncbi:DUF664 domain-containing protein [Amycolatopsis sp. lyj-84]|uniref:mycothiol transferase n=1 Tax=Amycolatopsis sp. lyj-84 TaxID=2789284 RepID=UPI00397E026B